MTPTTTPPAAGRHRAGYHRGPRLADRSQPCPNRNGIWPPIYKRQWDPLPSIARSNRAQREYQRCVHDALAAGELHRTTAIVLLAYSRASNDVLEDVWIAQATVAAKLGLSASTVCHHIARAKAAGWVQVQHRNRIDRGEVKAMSNITRFAIPARWLDELASQRARRQQEQTMARAERRRGGRTTPRKPSANPQTAASLHATPSSHAASAGAAEARTAPDYRTGEANLQELYRGQPALYEAAWAEYNATWSAVRRE